MASLVFVSKNNVVLGTLTHSSWLILLRSLSLFLIVAKLINQMPTIKSELQYIARHAAILHHN